MISQAGKAKPLRATTWPADFTWCPIASCASLLGCRVQDDLVQVDDFQRTSVPGIFCAGEPTGIGGLELSLVEGQIAGLAAAGRETAPGLVRGARKAEEVRPRARPHVHCCVQNCGCCPFPKPSCAGARMLPAHVWLSTLPGVPPNCRPVAEWARARAASADPATGFLFGWAQDSVRPPIFPARFENLCNDRNPELEHSEVTGGRG